MANTKMPLIQNNEQHPVSIEEIPLNSSHGEKKATQVDCPVSDRSNLGRRLYHRKILIKQRRLIVDLEFLFAMFGVVVMIVNTELFFSRYRNNLISFILEVLITITTVVLICLVLLFHWKGIKIYMLNNSLESWRLAFSWWTFLKIIAEVIVCSIQPIPDFGSHMTDYSLLGNFELHSDMNENIDPTSRAVPTNVILSLLMMFRLYLVGRLMVVHSNILIDSSVHSFTALSKMKLNFQFVFRALMTSYPGVVLFIIMSVIFLSASWSMHICETFRAKAFDAKESEIQSMWVVAITFLTVGYGDLVPSTNCGRFIAILTGLTGVGIVALCVTVLSNKLRQSQAEKYICTFIRRIRLNNVVRNSAATVLQEAFRLRILRKNGYHENHTWFLYHQRKFIKAIHLMREAALADIHMTESSIGIIDLYVSFQQLSALNKQIIKSQNTVLNRIKDIEDSLQDISARLDRLAPNKEKLPPIKDKLTPIKEGMASNKTCSKHQVKIT